MIHHRCFIWLLVLLLGGLAPQLSQAEEPTVAWEQSGVLPAAEATQAAAADEQFVYAISSTRIAKYERATGRRVATSTGEAHHLNSGFFWQGRLLCAHSNFPETPERSEIKVLDPVSMRLTTLKEFGNFGGSLTWVVREGEHWWCFFARYGKQNAESFLVQFDADWREQQRWTLPTNMLGDLGQFSLSGGAWHAGSLLATDHDHQVLYRLQVPAAGNRLVLVEKQPAPFTGQGIAADPKTGGLLGIHRAKRQAVFAVQQERMPWIGVADDHRGFVLASSGCPFVPWGFNYDHDHKGRLLEDYWDTEWPTVEEDFREMKRLGANVVRIHLQTGRFLETSDRANPKALARLSQLVHLAEQTGLYLDLTGLGCYHRQDVPAWYDKLSEDERWQAQARFWAAVAEQCAASPAIFCYDLMNEPVAPGGPQKEGNWLPGPGLAGKQFVQFITLDPKDRTRAKVAQDWTRMLVQAIRKHDRRHLITVGLLPGTPDRADAWSGFVPKDLADDLDFISVHLYPEKERVDQALKILARFAVGKPVLVEETFPLKCTIEEMGTFIDGSRQHASGWVSFYWGKTPEELGRSGELADAILRKWLEGFEAKGKELVKP